MSTETATGRQALTIDAAHVGQTVYKGSGDVPYRIIGVSPAYSMVSVVKATTPDRPGLKSTWQDVSRYAVETR